MTARVLIVDDDAAMCSMLRAQLGRRGFDVTTRETAGSAFEELRAQDIDVLVTDLEMSGMGGLELCRKAVADRPDVPVVVMTAFGSLETAIAAIRAGAYDFVPKPFDIEQLVIAIERAVQHRTLRQELVRLRRAAEDAATLGPEIVGQSAAMRRVYDLVDRTGESEASVLITGESGTGKELVARALHRRSRRRDGPFVAVNCAALPENLLESELFGHARGAFTDARAARNGLFVQAGGGTLFLDEIGELPPGLQAKLLRALGERVVRPLGSDGEVPFDARVLAATNRDLESLIEERRFRQDLYYRINVIHIELPPLRARGNDVLLLAQELLNRTAGAASKKIVGLAPAAAERILAYPWPGNVRELANCVERAVALARYDHIVPEDLPEKVRDYRSAHVLVAGHDPGELVTMEEVERRYIQRVLESVGGNKTLAARILGFDRTTLYRKLERFNLAKDA